MEQNFANAGEIRYAQVSSDERSIAILTHVLSIFFPILAPLIIYLVKRNESRYVGEHAKEALNFGISMCIYGLICLPLILIIIGLFFLIALGIASFIIHIIAAVKAADDVLYRYPFAIRFIK